MAPSGRSYCVRLLTDSAEQVAPDRSTGMRHLLVLAAFLILASTAQAAPYLAVATAKGVTGGKAHDEQFAIFAKGGEARYSLGKCSRKTSSRVVCRYTLEKLADDTLETVQVCRRNVTVANVKRSQPPTVKVRRLGCEAPS